MSDDFRCKAKVIVQGIPRQCKREAIFGYYCTQHKERDFEFDIDDDGNEVSKRGQ